MTFQIPPNIFLPTDCLMKIKVSQAQVFGIWFVFKEAPVHKKGVQRSAQPRHE